MIFPHTTNSLTVFHSFEEDIIQTFYSYFKGELYRSNFRPKIKQKM